MKDSQKYLLAIDNGTQSVRALIFDFQGQLVAKSKIDIEAYFSVEPGWAEQEPEYLWDMLCKACHELWPKLNFPKSQIHAVALTTQRATMVNIDHEGRSLRPAFIWLDQRQTDDVPSIGPLWEGLFKVAGVQKTVKFLRTQTEANWIRSNQPDVWQQTHKYLLLSGYHTYKLTGKFVDSVASQVGYLPFDYKRHQWCKEKDWKWKAFAMNPSILPDLIPCGSELGKITEKASSETGIPAGVPLISAGADKACEVLGSGCLDQSIGSLSYGTTATYNNTNFKYREVIPYIPPYPAAVPGAYNTEMLVQRGYWMVSWFKREFGLREEQLAKQRGIEPELLFDELLKQVPPGAQGLMLQPYWNPGIKTPGPEAKGAMIGFGDVHTRAHIYRAIIEGITYALREGKELSEKKLGHNIKRLKVSGGGSQSDEVMQITADIFGMVAERPHTFETSGLGAAINAAVGTGIYPDYKSAVTAMTHDGQKFTPNKHNNETYNRLYQEVYKKMYGKLEPLYKSIQAITGYPT